MFYQAYHLGGIEINVFHAVYALHVRITDTNSSWRVSIHIYKNLPGSLHHTFQLKSYLEMTYILPESQSCPPAKAAVLLLVSN